MTQKKAVELGADAIVISNHGARQLDSVAPTIRVLPEILAAVDGKIDVLLDGGIPVSYTHLTLPTKRIV